MSLEFEQTSIYFELQKILGDGSKPVRKSIKAIIHTEAENFSPMKVNSIDVVRDYKAKVGDVIHVQFALSLGDYVKRFYPYRDNLELTLTRIPLTEVGEKTSTNETIDQERYKMVFIPGENEQVATSEYDNIDKFTLDLMKVVDVRVELLDRAMEPLRVKTVGGVFKNMSHHDMMRGIIGGESNKVLVDGKRAIEAMDIVKPQNETIHKQIAIPHGTNITALPTYFQENGQGVYAAGVGNFLQKYNGKRTWFVYPLYNPKRFEENIPKVIFYSVPRNKHPSIERSYRQDGKIMYVAITSGKSYKDSAETDFMKSGVGFRMANAAMMMNRPVNISNGIVSGIRKGLNFEVAIKERKDGLNYAPVADRDISSNPFSQYSRVAERNGGRVDMTWENSNPDLIYPGMPCKYVYILGDEIRQQRGIILFSHSLTQPDSAGVNSKGYTTVTQLTLFVEGIKTSDF